MEELVRCEHVFVALPGDARFVLQDICWTLTKGEHTALLGANGSGKSTLLRLLGGLIWSSKGRIVWKGCETSPLVGRAMSSLVSPALQLRYQKNAWTFSGLELVATGYDRSDQLYQKKADLTGRIRSLSAELSCEDLLFRDISQLSQGQLRILLLVRALVSEPELLLLDECADGLDAKHARALHNALLQCAKKTTIVFVTHEEERIPDFCTERRTLVQGAFSQNAPRRSIKIVHHPHSAQGASGPILLTLTNASVYLERVQVLFAINWTVRAGEHWLILGENGSGKSTLLRLLYGDVFCAAGGSIERFLPKVQGRVESVEQLRRGMSLVSSLSEVAYDYPVTALELVCSGFENSIGLYRTYSDEEKDKARTLIARFFSDAECDRLCSTRIALLSTGQLRRLFLARALVCDPDILLLDEPMSGLDAESSRRYCALLSDLAHTCTLIVAAHETDNLPDCFTHCARMQGGRLTECPAQTLLLD